MDEKVLEEILESYSQELADLKERRRKKAIRRANMSEEELIKDLQAEFAEVLEDAKAEGIPIVAVGETPPSDDEK